MESFEFGSRLLKAKTEGKPRFFGSRARVGAFLSDSTHRSQILISERLMPPCGHLVPFWLRHWTISSKHAYIFKRYPAFQVFMKIHSNTQTDVVGFIIQIQRLLCKFPFWHAFELLFMKVVLSLPGHPGFFSTRVNQFLLLDAMEDVLLLSKCLHYSLAFSRIVIGTLYRFWLP